MKTLQRKLKMVLTLLSVSIAAIALFIVVPEETCAEGSFVSCDDEIWVIWTNAQECGCYTITYPEQIGFACPDECCSIGGGGGSDPGEGN